MLYLMIETYATFSARNVLKIRRSAFSGTPGIVRTIKHSILLHRLLFPKHFLLKVI